MFAKAIYKDDSAWWASYRYTAPVIIVLLLVQKDQNKLVAKSSLNISGSNKPSTDCHS